MHPGHGNGASLVAFNPKAFKEVVFVFQRILFEPKRLLSQHGHDDTDESSKCPAVPPTYCGP
jgi:hypothetical protein